MRALPLLLCAACGSRSPSSGPPKLVDPAGDSGGASDAGGGDGAADGGTDGADGTDGTDGTDEPRPTYEECFADLPGGAAFGLDYAQFGPTLGRHCMGTDHQDIQDVQRVVFLGDSITVGSPPADPDDFYRSLLADSLARRFDLAAPDDLWKLFDVVNGTSLIQESGGFASCAKWGARADDLLRDNDQLVDCLPEDRRGERTLVVMTVGGNDLFNLTEDFLAGRPVEDLWADTQEFVQLLEDAVVWIKEPGRFPNGVDVVFANFYEFTDGTGRTVECPAAGLAGYGAVVIDPALEEMVLWANEQYMRVAVENGADLIFMLEGFCGHGYSRDDDDGRCYRGPDAELWFDETCFHPNAAGHAAIAEMFDAVVAE
jgi:lysophospholipase L1-like esterase